MQINQEQSHNEEGVGTGSMHISSGLTRVVVIDSDKAHGNTGHKRTSSGLQRQTKHSSVFNYEPLTAEHHEDDNEADVVVNILPDERGDSHATSSVAALKQVYRQFGPSKNFTTALRRSLSPIPTLHNNQGHAQHHAPLSPNFASPLPASASTPLHSPNNSRAFKKTDISSSSGFIQKAKSVLSKKSARYSTDSVPAHDLSMANRVSSSANVPIVVSASSPHATSVAKAYASRDRTTNTSDERAQRSRRNQAHAFPRGLSFPRGADRIDVVNENSADEFDDDEDDISSPYNADEIQTHIMPHGPAPDKDFQYLFDAPLQHRVPVDESEARKLERDLKTLVEAFENGHGDPFGLENDSVVQTMHELREKQESITAQMFALDHTEYWTADNRFGMQKMKNRLDNMITAVDDLCQSLKQLPSHDELGSRFTSKSTSRHHRRRRSSQRDAGGARTNIADFDNADNNNNQGQELSSASSDADELSTNDAAAGGGITFNIPVSRDDDSAHQRRGATDADVSLHATGSRQVHRRSISHPEPADAGGSRAVLSSEAIVQPAVRANVSQVAPPQAPPRSTRRTVRAELLDAEDNLMSRSTSAVAGAKKNRINSFEESGDHRNVDFATSLNIVTDSRVPLGEARGAGQNMHAVPSRSGEKQKSSYKGDVDDAYSSDATVVARESRKIRNLLLKSDVEVGDNNKASQSARFSPRKAKQRTAALELSERSVTPLHSPSTESFQSAMSPYLSP